MHPSLGPFLWYDVLTHVAYVAAGLYVYGSLRKVPSIQKGRLLFAVLGGGLVSLYGGAVLPFVYHAIQSAGSPPPLLGSGRYFHSVFLSMLLYIWGVTRVFRWPTSRCFDHYAIATLFMSAIGRIGCFLQGCCRGKPTGLPWAVEFPDRLGVYVHPTQVYMFWVEISLLGFLVWFNRRKRYDGQTFWTAVFLYSIYRIWIETMRTNPIFAFGLTHAQSFSVLTLALSSAVLVRRALHPPR